MNAVRWTRSWPEFLFETLSGKVVTDRTVEGQNAVIYFWSPWCLACMLELPALLRLNKLHPNVDVLAVAIDAATLRPATSTLRRRVTDDE
jgi:thiol-disulfide isomerase/thioredoxin